MMKAYAQTQYGGPEVLKIMEVPKPTPGPRDLLVKVIGTALNPLDTKVRRNKYFSDMGPIDPTKPRICGWDGAGIVETVGSDVTLFKPGDEVMFAGCIDRQGCHAEYVAVDERIVGHKPKKLSFVEAAALPLTSLTAWESIAECMHLPIPGECGAADDVNANISLLIVSGAGGVGSIAIQLAKKIFKIGRVIATASRPETIKYCQRMGADAVINHKEPMKPQLERIGLKTVDYVLDNYYVSENFDELEKLITPLGYFVGISPGYSPIDIRCLVHRRITFAWELMFTRPLFNVEPEKQHQILENIARLADEGVIHHRAETVLPWNKLPEAHRLQDTDSVIGKIVLQVDFKGAPP